MSDREDIIIEADNIQLRQGETVKDYNVIVKNNLGTPLSDMTVNISFYNDETTFVNEATTNEYGVASVPLLLSGYSWKVDIHFKGDEEYKPCIVTKNVVISKWQQLNTQITSKHLQLNENRLINNLEDYYTIVLSDIQGNKIANEPVQIAVDSTETGDNYMTAIIKTDENGEIAVPFCSHNENVLISSNYMGCARYKESFREDIVAFDDIDPKNSVSFSISQDETQLMITHSNGVAEDISEATDTVERVIINYDGDYRTVHDGIKYYESMGENTYKVTLFYKGNSTYYAHTETLTFEKSDDTRKSIWGWIGDQTEVPMETFTTTSLKQGSLNHLEVTCNYELPYEQYAIGVKGGKIDGTYDMIIKAIPKYDGNGNTVLDAYFTNVTDETTINFVCLYKVNDYINSSQITNDWIPFASTSKTLTTSNRSDVDVAQSGFGRLTQTYQQVDIFVNDGDAPSQARVNEYYIAKLLNTATLEEFYLYSYLNDNVTPSHLEFLLTIGDWDFDIVTKDTDEWNGGMYHTNATLEEDEHYEVADEFFYTEDNWVTGNDYNTSAPLELWINGANISADNTTWGYAVTDEYTNSNKYELHFHCTFGRNPIRPQDGASANNGFFIGVDPTEDTSYFVNNYCKGRSGIYVNCSQIIECKNGYPINTVFISNVNDADFTVTRDGDEWHIYRDDELIYSANNLPKNSLGFYCDYYPTLSNVSVYYKPVAEITPSVDDYDGSIYGSNLHLEVRDDHLNLIDYGMLPSGAIGSGKVIVNDVPINANSLELELETKYNNTRFQRLNNLTGEIQMRVYEDVSTSDSAMEYSQVLCSPMVVPNVQTVFTRHSEEGILYYIKDPKMTDKSKQSPYYLCNGYTQYKGGCSIQSETGIQLFDLDNAFTPVFVGNNLVRAEFHRRSGYIKLSRWDEQSGDWCVANVLKLKNNPQLTLVEYNDDYAEIQFGKTTWKFYRGRPFIVCNHKNDDLRILNLVDRVYCETSENERGLGFIQETNPNQRIRATDESGKELDNYSTFDPQLSVQQFKQELHIGQNIRTDNFELYDIDANYNLQDPNDESLIGVVPVDDENALLVAKESGSKLALNFPSYSSYVKRVDSTFTLFIGYVDSDISSFKIKARGFDDRGAVPVYDSIQYGIWEQTKNVTVDVTETDEIRVTFTNCPTDVKYLDFVIIFNSTSASDIILKDFMYYQGDSQVNYDIDNSKAYAEQVEILFNETYFANIYNDNENVGLCIIRPSQHKFSLTNIYADTETVFAPYMRKCQEWDKPSQILLEYLNSKRQVIDIDWEN